MTRKHTLPAGTYFIGDPCYLIPDDDWDKIGDNTNWFGCDNQIMFPDKPVDWDDGLYHWKNKLCFASHTRYGDGVYYDGSHRREFWVDSGLIGVTPIEGAFSDNLDLGFWAGGLIMDFRMPVIVWENEGVFYINRMKIDTRK